MAQELYNLISDDNLRDELVRCLRNRTMEQKFLYLNDGAKNYYDVKNVDPFTHSETSLSTEDFVEFGRSQVLTRLNPARSATMISLGCGNSNLEGEIFRKLGNERKFHYIGVDSSQQMLGLSTVNIGDVDSVKSSTLIRADFSTQEFRRELSVLTSNFANLVFCFFSNTFGNLNPTDITDILHNLLTEGELIWMDVRIRKGKTAKDDIADSEMYYNYLRSEEWLRLLFNPLKQLGIPFESGKMGLTSKKEAALNALKFQYSFHFNAKTVVDIRKEKIIILPGESIDLVQTTAYDPVCLAEFFSEHGFSLLHSQVRGLRGQFLFQKA